MNGKNSSCMSDGFWCAVDFATLKFRFHAQLPQRIHRQLRFPVPECTLSVSCTFNPPSGTLTPNGSLKSVLTVKVNSRPAGAAAYQPPSATPRVSGKLEYLAGLLLALGFSFMFGLGRASARFEPAWGKAALGFAIVIFGCLAACGGGSSSFGPPPPPPPQSATVVIQIQASSPSITKTSG